MMKEFVTIAAAVLLSGLFFAPGIAAQGELPVPTPEEQGLPEDPVPGGGPVVKTPRDTDQDVESLQMRAGGSKIHIVGTPGDPVGVVLGVDQTAVQLPGGSVLRVAPLLVFAVGHIGSNGQLTFDLYWDGPALLPFTVFAQAFRIGDSLLLSSEIAKIEYGDDGLFKTSTL